MLRFFIRGFLCIVHFASLLMALNGLNLWLMQYILCLLMVVLFRFLVLWQILLLGFCVLVVVKKSVRKMLGEVVFVSDDDEFGVGSGDDEDIAVDEIFEDYGYVCPACGRSIDSSEWDGECEVCQFEGG
jgi:hypothetical protein